MRKYVKYIFLFILLVIPISVKAEIAIQGLTPSVVDGSYCENGKNCFDVKLQISDGGVAKYYSSSYDAGGYSIYFGVGGVNSDVAYGTTTTVEGVSITPESVEDSDPLKVTIEYKLKNNSEERRSYYVAVASDVQIYDYAEGGG